MSASFYSADDLAGLWISLKLAIVTAVALLLLCTPLAWWLAMTRSRLRVIGEAMAALPLVLRRRCSVSTCCCFLVRTAGAAS